MAKNYSELQTVMEILRQVFKLPRRNKKIFFFIAGMFAIISLVSGFFNKYVSPSFGMDPKSPEYQNQLSKIKQDTLFQIIYGLVLSVVSLVTIVATIYVSAMSYIEKDLTLKGLFLKMKKVWIRPVVTGFYFFFLISAGLFLLVIPITIIIVVVYSWKGSVVDVTAVGVVLALPAMLLNIYLVLLWMLSLVVSVLEDCYGLQAIAKAKELVKGRKAVGLVLTFALMLPGNALAIVSMMKNQPTEMSLMMKNQLTEMLIAFVSLFSGILVNILGSMMYTVLYFDYKERRGEQVEVEEELKYSALSTIHP